MKKRRVAVTGVGLITPCGTGTEKTWENIKNGVCGIDVITKIDVSKFETKIAGEVRDFDPLNFFERKELRRIDIFIQYAIAATHFALEQAKIEFDKKLKERTGVIIGVGLGGLEIIEKNKMILEEKGPRRISPFFIPMLIGNEAAANVSIRWGFKGPNFCVTTACASGAHSIGEAFKIIQRGAADVIIAGGAESVISPLSICGFNAMKALSRRNEEPKKASRPFDKERDGFVMGEGAGLIVLEDMEFAKERGANILAELVGYGLCCEAYHIAAPAPDGVGMAMSMRLAIEDAGINSEESIDYINAHGTSTELNDKYETAAIKNIFGEHAYKLKVSSTKSMMGHLLGAAGGVEAGISVLALKDGVIPPTINYENPDPDCDLNYVPNKSIEQKLNYVMSNSFGFGGQNATLIFKRYEE